MKTNTILVAGTALLVSVVCQAQDNGSTGFDLGGFKFHPGVGLKFTHDDNIFQSETNTVSSWITTLAPTARFIARQRANTYRFGYEGEKGIYESSSADNYFDHRVYADAHLAFATRTALALRADYKKGHEDRGSTDRTLSSEPDKYDQTSVGAVFAYGAKTAKGRLELEADWLDREYTNNRSNTEISDRDESKLRATFFYRVMPKTSLLAEVVHKQFDYDLAVSTQDSDETKYYAGATWEATGKTTGTVKLGFKEKDFDSPTRQDVDSMAWLANVRWSLRTYSVINFTASKDFAESSGVGDTIDSTRYGVAWTHNWNRRLSTNAGLTFGKEAYKGDTSVNGGAREDDIKTFALGANYKMRRWLTLGGGVSYTDSDSNSAGDGYDRTKFYISLLAEF